MITRIQGRRHVSRHRLPAPTRRIIVAASAIILATGSAACSTGAEPSAEPAPACAGVATSEYGLGDAVRDAAFGLTALPNRFSTGAGTVSVVPGSDALSVEIHLCGPGAGADETKDAASLVAGQIATAPLLGTEVGRVTVVNPSTSQTVVAEPFDAEAFRGADVDTDDGLSALRGQWQVEVR